MESTSLPWGGGAGGYGGLSELCGLSYSPCHVGWWSQEGALGPPGRLRLPGHDPSMLQALTVAGVGEAWRGHQEQEAAPPGPQSSPALLATVQSLLDLGDSQSAGLHSRPPQWVGQ